MAKVLNVDSLIKERQEISIEGVIYPMKQMSVEDFIKLTKKAEAIDKKKTDTPSARIEFLVDTILISFPTCSDKVLKAQPIEVLNAIVEFAKDGTLPEDLEEDLEEDEKKDQEQN